MLMRPWLIFILLALIGLYLWPAHAPQLVVRSQGEAQIGGDFTLTDTHGKTVSDKDFHGRPLLVYMGYSHCPDICPMTLGVMSETLKALGPDADKVTMIFISLDPERDTPQALGDYLKAFDGRITGLTGSAEQVEHAASVYRVVHEKSAENAGNYQIDHSGFLYLMDRQGKYAAHFDTNVKVPELTQKIREQF